MLVGFGGSEKGGFKGNWVKGSEFAFFIRDGGEMWSGRNLFPVEQCLSKTFSQVEKHFWNIILNGNLYKELK